VVNLIIISDSPKMAHIERFLKTTIEVKIDVVADIDQALRDIFVKRPTVVCIQNRISDINADEIARHIKMLLRNGAPSFILMHEGDGSAKPVTGLFEHLLDLSLPETKLAEALGAALKSILGTQWEHVLLSSPPQENKPLETSAPPSPSSTHPAIKPRPARAHPAAGAAQQDNSPAPKPAVWAPSAKPASAVFNISTTDAAAAVLEQNEIAPFIENVEHPEMKWKRRAGIALAIVACTAAWYLLRQKQLPTIAVPLPTPVPTAVHKAISSVRPPLGKAAVPSPELPAFVPADGRDSAYATRYPGWERYAGTDYECRIFRENNRIKAVQVLSGNRQDLDEELLKKVLVELVGNDHYRVASRERVRGYLIERGSVVGKADLMLYIQNSKLHAFVVSLN
jgi:hypothetical protein